MLPSIKVAGRGGIMTCDHKLTNHNVNQFQPITAVHSQITTCEVKGYVTRVGDQSLYHLLIFGIDRYIHNYI